MKLGLSLSMPSVAGRGGSAPLDTDAIAHAARATTMDSTHTRRLSNWIRMLKGEAGSWEQLSEDVWTSKAKMLVPLMGEYQLMPAGVGDNFVSLFDVRALHDLTPTNLSAAERGIRFTGTNYALSTGKVINSSPWWAFFIGCNQYPGGAQEVMISQFNGSGTAGRTNFINNQTTGEVVAFYNDGASEQAGAGGSILSNEPRGIASRNTGAGGASDLAIYIDGSATPHGTSDTGRTYAVQDTNLGIGVANNGTLAWTGYGMLAGVGEGVVSAEDLAKIVRNSDRIFRLGMKDGYGLRPLPNGNYTSQVALQAAAASGTAFLGSPSIIPFGSELLAFHDTFGTSALSNTGKCLASADGGETWSARGSISATQWMTPVDTGDGSLYLFGMNAEFGDVVVRETTDAGANWTSDTILAGDYHSAPVPILVKDGVAYWCIEGAGTNINPSIRPNTISVLSAPIASDLTSAASWTQSNVLAFEDIEATLGIDVNSPYYQEPIEHNMLEFPDGTIGAIGRILNGPSWASHLTLTAGVLACVGHIDFPLGRNKFCIVRCPATGSYLGFGNPDPDDLGERCKLVCLVTSDPRDWSGAVEHVISDLGSVNYQEESLSYPYVSFDGDDLLVVVRAAWNGAVSSHNTNRDLFWRITNYVSRYNL